VNARVVRPPGFEPGHLLTQFMGEQKRGRQPAAVNCPLIPS